MLAGIDFSTRTVDVVLLDADNRATYTRRRIEATNPVQAARNVRDALPARSAWAGVLAIGIERPFGHPATVTALVRIQGAVLACIPAEIPVFELGATSWKKRFVGHGHASKEEVRNRATPILIAGGERDVTEMDPRYHQDTCDACGLAYAARELYEEHYQDPTMRKVGE